MREAALYFVGDGAVEQRSVDVPEPAADEVLVETSVSAISAGTELLVYREQTPTEIAVDSTIEGFDDGFSYPLKYGYALVGQVTETGADVSETWRHRRVFSFSPHQTHVVADPDSLVTVPETIGTDTAALLPTVETATTVTLDSQPRLDERVVVFGAGVVGLCTIQLLSSFPLAELVVVEPVATRREMAVEMGADRAVAPTDDGAPVSDADLAIELSGKPAVLNDAIDCVGYDGRIVVGSWYGTKTAEVNLGGRFHRDRIEMISSQVSTVDPALSGRWDKERVLQTALQKLEQLDVAQLITHRVPFTAADDAYELLASAPDDALQVLLTYDSATYE